MKNLKEELDEISEGLDDGGILHAGYVHYIQQSLSGSGDFILKAAIYQVLESVPSIFPANLPELVEEGKVKQLNEEQQKRFHEIDSTLIIPLHPSDLLDIISTANEYIKKAKERKNDKH